MNGAGAQVASRSETLVLWTTAANGDLEHTFSFGSVTLATPFAVTAILLSNFVAVRYRLEVEDETVTVRIKASEGEVDSEAVLFADKLQALFRQQDQRGLLAEVATKQGTRRRNQAS